MSRFNVIGTAGCARLSLPAAMAGLLVLALAGSTTASAGDRVLLDAARYQILAGRYSPFARFQANLQRVLDACGKSEPAVVAPGEEPDGRIGMATRRGVMRATGCDALRTIPADSPAREGAITEALWRAASGGQPLPSTQDLAKALVLSFEATDFGDAPEWNLCQDGGQPGAIAKAQGQHAVCYNESDPCSFLTWGPRGATAGAGREIQYILWLVSKRDPELLRKAFGREFDSMHRFLRLRGGGKEHCDGNMPLKKFVCSVWLDQRRRRAWEGALAVLGHSPLVRDTYAQLYALREFDGIKLRAYYQLWRDLGLTPSQIDYAFFLDRATHLGGPPEDEDRDEAVETLKQCLANERTTAVSVNGAARRCLARLQPHETQPDYRLARDVAYYLDAYPEGVLSEKEIRAWGGYVPLSAVHNFGLSDATPFTLDESAPLASLGPDLPDADSGDLTPTESSACPAGVLSPIHRKPN